MLLANNIQFPLRLAWWIALLGLVFLLALNNYTSTGISRGGEDDEGSGIGGTGLQQLTRGVGPIGPRPVLSLSEDAEVVILQQSTGDTRSIVDALAVEFQDRESIALPPLPAPASVTRKSWLTKDSAAIDISEHIQYQLASNAMHFEVFELDSLRDSNSAMEQPGTEVDKQPNWRDLSAYLANQSPDRVTTKKALAETQAGSEADPIDRDTRSVRPAPLQRPALPPVRRAVPIRRANVLPPRIKPLRL